MLITFAINFHQIKVSSVYLSQNRVNNLCNNVL